MRPLAFLAVLTALLAPAGCGEQRVAGGPAKGNAATFPAAPSRAKPASPIALDLEFDAPAPGGVVRIHLSATSQVDLDRCEITVRLPEGLTVVEGQTKRQVALARGQRQTHSLDIRAPDGRRYEIAATARARIEEGTVAARSISRALNDTVEKPAASEGGLKTNSRGEAIRELPAGPPRGSPAATGP
jgi:hypothetical protein